MLHATIKPDRTTAYVALLALLIIYIVLFATLLYSQELPTAPRASVKQQELGLRKPGSLPKSNRPDLGSADWFRERGHFKLALFMPLLEHIDWDISYDKSGKHRHSSRNK